MGGPKKFYSRWYINSLCPLGFVKVGKTRVNANYYDTPLLREASLPFILSSLGRQLKFGVRRDYCVCLGTGKNADFLRKLNAKHNFFGEIIPLEHPRYVIQYKSRETDKYVQKYAEVLNRAFPTRATENQPLKSAFMAPLSAASELSSTRP